MDGAIVNDKLKVPSSLRNDGTKDNKAAVVSGREVDDDVNSTTMDTYKQIPENEMEAYEDVENKQVDGALEKMLPPRKDDENNVQQKNVEIKFVTDKENGDAKLNISDPKCEFVGMSKEELLRYANDPFWVKLRYVLFVCFWLLWAGMLIGAVLIIVAAPKCVPPEPRTWWELGPLVEIDRDVSDESLNVFKTNRVEGVVLDLSDDDEDDAYITRDDDARKVTLKSLAERLKSYGLNAIVTLNAATSKKWFELSEGKDDKYVDYYVWSDAKGHNASGDLIPPNNWIATDNKSSWEYSSVRNQFYLVEYDDGPKKSRRPRLNMRDSNVVEEFAKVIETYLDLGFNGIRVKGGAGLLYDDKLRDESISNEPGYVQTEYGFYAHTRTTYVDDSGAVLKRWRDVVKNVTSTATGGRGGVFTLTDDLRKLDPFKVNGTALTIDLPMHTARFTKVLTSLVDGNSKLAGLIKQDVDGAYRVVEDNWPLWKSTTPTMLPDDVIDHVTFLLRGTTLLDAKRASSSSSFSSIVDVDLINFRRDNPAILYGSLETYNVQNGSVFAFTRVTPGNPGYLVAVNLLNERLDIDLSKEVPVINEDVTVQFLSGNYNETNVAVKYKIRANNVPISPLSSMVLSYVPKKEDD